MSRGGAGNAAGMPELRPAVARGRWCRGGIQATEAFSRGGTIDRDWMGRGPMRVLSRQDWAPGATRDDGRVANMERLLVVIEGVLDVDCGAPGRQRVGAGGALWLGAGHGMESRLGNASPAAALRLLECWLQPERVNAAPAMAALGPDARGDVDVVVDAGGATGAGSWWTVAAGDGGRDTLPLRLQGRVLSARIAPGGGGALPAGQCRRYWLEVLEGTVSAGGQRLGAGDGLGWLAGSAGAPASLRASGTGAAWLLLFELPA